jgi:bifunctional non-homologous end joining protein LigD
LHEIKLDGYRIGCRIDHGAVQLMGRRGSAWGDKFPELREAARKLPATTALLDGEVAVVDPEGHTHFQLLQELLSGGSRAGLVYFVFDLLHLDGEDLTRRPLEERKQRLDELLRAARPGLPVRSVGHIIGNGAAVFAQACQLGLEGIVSKRREQPHQPGRGMGWLKTKCALRQEFVVGGFTLPKGTRTGIGALFCGHTDDAGNLLFAGKVGTGFTERTAVDLRRQLEPLEQTTCPFTPLPDPASRRGARWVQPRLVVEVRFANWTGDGRLRHASFEGVRTDKLPGDVHREQPHDPDEPP